MQEGALSKPALIPRQGSGRTALMDTVESCVRVRDERKVKGAKGPRGRHDLVARPQHLEIPTSPRIGSQSVKSQIHCETCHR